MLAPVLARLDGIRGVIESRVDATGRFFLLALSADADEARVLEDAREALRGRAVPLDAAAAAAQLAARPRGDPWPSAAEVRMLSYVEARVVAATTADVVASRAGLPRQARDVVAEALRVELFAAIERVHAEGGRDSSAWFYEEWPAIAAAALARCAAAIDPAARERAATSLREAHGGR